MDALIHLLHGDGIGPEVAQSGKNVLARIGQQFGHNFTFSEQYIGGAAIDHCNDPLPSNTISSCKESDAVILGAVGGPKWDNPNAKNKTRARFIGFKSSLKSFC